MRRVWRRTQENEKATARDASRRAKQAAGHALKQARGLERAQRHAGVSERAFEGEFLKNELGAERMEGRAEELGGQAEEMIEHFYGRMEEQVERRADEMCDAA